MSKHLDRLQRLHAPTKSRAESIAAGRARRRDVPRSAHGAYRSSGRDAVAMLEEQNRSRLEQLVPLRFSRMAADPFAFFRGTAAIMAADLARGVSTGIEVVACGDAHVGNFGLFASPQRTLVFDLNDFDEAAAAPWEWDVKRLVTSVIVGGRASGFTKREIRDAALATARSYRTSLAQMMKLSALERFYSRADTETVRGGLDAKAKKVLDRATRKAKTRTSQSYIEKITVHGPGGKKAIVEDPPVLTHVAQASETVVEGIFERYRATVSIDIAMLLSKFALTDLVMRVVGVGSVGTRCYLLILSGPAGESLVLQVKEAQPSVLQTFGGYEASEVRRHLPGEGAWNGEGHRVVSNQRILQAVSDPFLGHLTENKRDYYVRQFRVQKGSIDVSRLGLRVFERYCEACGTLLARAHAQSRDAAEIDGYLGNSSVFDEAAVAWSLAYADQSFADFTALSKAIASGRVPSDGAAKRSTS